jgi:5'-nucleotidase
VRGFEPTASSPGAKIQVALAVVAFGGAAAALRGRRAAAAAAATAAGASTAAATAPPPSAPTSEPPLAAKRRALVSGGPGALHLILDYDRTMTSFLGPDGRRGDTCHGTVERRRSEELRARAEALSAVFYPIEVDPLRSRESKVPLMETWYMLVNEILVAAGMTRRDLREDVAAANLRLRPGIAAALDWAARHDVPVTVFSAGIGDVIEEVLRQRYRATPHAKLRVVSNAMVWSGEPGDDDAKVVGFSAPVLHPFNKFAGAVLSSLPYFAELRARPHVLLLGDSPGDVGMADGLDAAHVLRVGFLNDNVEQLRARYEQLFDIVVTHDGGAECVTELLAEIEAGVRSAPSAGGAAAEPARG